MAIARGAGTEIIRTIHHEDVDSTDGLLIFGEQHHIYTVLSVVCWMRVNVSDPDWIQLYLIGWDSFAGATGQQMNIFQQNMNQTDTFIWNDKFSFNGHEPLASSMSGGTTTIAEQNAIADQASTVPQKLFIGAQASGNKLDVTCTFIDQNNA